MLYKALLVGITHNGFQLLAIRLDAIGSTLAIFLVTTSDNRLKIIEK